MSSEKQHHVLSIQSTVVSGYVGNKCASFALQVLGFDVCPINSVQLSNHTGYSCFQGQVLNADDVGCLYEGLKKNNIHCQFSHLLTGYIGSKSFLEKVGEIISDVRQSNPGLMYVCDPVMGDHGKLYVPDDLLPVYQNVIVPQADIVTPNQFEAELLTGMKIASEADALAAMQKLHDMGPKTVVLSSTNLGSEGILVGLASSIQNNDLKVALEKTVSTVQTVIKRTILAAKEAAGPGNSPNPAQMELRLIQSKSDIEKPDINFTATQLSC